MRKIDEPLPHYTWREFLTDGVPPIMGCVALVIAVQIPGIIRWICAGIYAVALIREMGK